MDKLILGTRSSGRTHTSLEYRKENKAVLLMPHRLPSKAFTEIVADNGLCERCDIKFAGDDLSGVRQLVIDDIDEVLRMVLAYNYGFKGEIIGASLLNDKLNIEVLNIDGPSE